MRVGYKIFLQGFVLFYFYNNQTASDDALGNSQFTSVF